MFISQARIHTYGIQFQFNRLVLTPIQLIDRLARGNQLTRQANCNWPEYSRHAKKSTPMECLVGSTFRFHWWEVLFRLKIETSFWGNALILFGRCVSKWRLLNIWVFTSAALSLCYVFIGICTLGSEESDTEGLHFFVFWNYLFTFAIKWLWTNF